jgi:CHAD domain-containing protein
LPSEQVRGSAAAQITKTLAAEREDAVRQLDKGMRSARYDHLVQLLRAWRAAPPFTQAATDEARAAINYVDKAQQKADKRLRKAEDIEQLHRARKSMKRARYAAELVEPADGDMKAVARKAEELQTLLGEHQDAVVSARFLTALNASRDGKNSNSAFTYGVLMANELNRAARIRASLRK